MADDSLEIRKDDVPFHPCLTPRGMTWYDLNVLTVVQQKLLNEIKSDLIRENNQYLAKHPEVRALIIIFLRAILKEKPKLISIADFAKDFFCARPLNRIQSEVDQYLKARGEPLNKQGNSAVNLEFEFPKREPSLEDMTCLYGKEYYSWRTLTDTTEPSLIGEAAPEWGSYDDLRFGYYPTFSDTYTTFGSETTGTEFELLFASRATPYSGQSLEATTISLTKQYIQIFGGAPVDKQEGTDDENTEQLSMIAEEELEMDLQSTESNRNPSSILHNMLSADAGT